MTRARKKKIVKIIRDVTVVLDVRDTLTKTDEMLLT